MPVLRFARTAALWSFLPLLGAGPLSGGAGGDQVAIVTESPPVVAPLRPGDTGAAVGALQDGLRALAERGAIAAQVAPSHPTARELGALVAELSAERAVMRFGPTTASLVALIQVQQGLGDLLRGVVDARTADVLNGMLRARGLLTSAGAAAASPMPQVVHRPIATRPPVVQPHLLTPVRAPLTPGASGDGVRALQDALTALASRTLIRTVAAPETPTASDISTLMTTMALERTTGTFGVATQRLVMIVQLQQGLGDQRRGHVDAATAQAINALLGITQR